MQDKKLITARVESVARIAKSKKDVASNLDTAKVNRHVEGLVKPKSPKSTLKKAGIALIAAPDPVTGVAGVALVASSLALSKKEPLNLAEVSRETAKILRELNSFSV